MSEISPLARAVNYLNVFYVATPEEKQRHIARLFDAANDAASSAGATDFHELINSSRVMSWAKALTMSRQKYDSIDTAIISEKYWLSAYAVVHLIILNTMGSFEPTDEAAKVARIGEMLYLAEHRYRQISN